jgi:DNA adenine methylase
MFSASLTLTAPLAESPPQLLKWVGSKQRLALPLGQRVLEALVQGGGAYYEPFAGSLAVFFRVWAHGWRGRAFLSDHLKTLIDCYLAIREAPKEVARELAALGSVRESPTERGGQGVSRKTRGGGDAGASSLGPLAAEEDYYATREAFNRAQGSPSLQAARFLYLNHRGFNGLYRTNRRGEMSVPWGGARREPLPSPAALARVSQALEGAGLEACDFASAIARAGQGDVVYADPPYDGGYCEYSGRFHLKDQERLAAALYDAHRRGAQILASNRDTPRVRALYGPPFLLQPLEIAHIVGGSRSRVRELLITTPP